MIRFRFIPAAVTFALLLPLSAGCDLGQNSNLVHVLTTHHATPEAGVFPDRGGEGDVRVFESDLGWRITLAEAYLVTSSIRLESCDGDVVDLDMYFGPVAEDLRDADLETLSLGGEQVPAGSYCALQVEYAPYVVPEDGIAEREYSQAVTDAVDGNTLHLMGLAEKGRDEIRFEFRTPAPVIARLDLSALVNGRPLMVRSNEFYPVELTVSKTYDRFFDGIDFATMNASAVEADLAQPLATETRVALGTRAANGN